jgi:polar amino acid transport system ATP-binding protein
VIDVKNLSKSFGDHLVLDDLTQHIYPGEKVVVIGPSGSGKSTFLRCLNLLEIPTAGTITFNGHEITDPKADIDKLRQQMGMCSSTSTVPQHDHPEEHHPGPGAHQNS